MASSSKQLPEETAEEIMARKRMIMGGGQTKHAGYTHGLEGTEIMMNRDGSNGFSLGNDLTDQYTWNEKTGDYRSNGGGIMNIAEIPQMQAAAAAPDKGPKKKKKKKPETGEVVYPDGKVIDTNPGGGYGGWQTGMTNYQPVTPNTHLNPLADANNWMYTPDPQYGVINNPGIYVNNPKPKGLI